MSSDELESEAQRALVAEARALPLSYGVRILESPSTRRRVVILGEAHLKFARAGALGARLVDAFALRGVETFPVRGVLFGRLLMILIVVPRLLLRVLSFGAIKGSTITYARARPEGATVLLEHGQAIPLGLHLGSLHLAVFMLLSMFLLALWEWCTRFPQSELEAAFWTLLPVVQALQQHVLWTSVPAWLLRRFRFSWLLLPMLAILTLRDRSMAAGTLRMLADHPGTSPPLVIMGRAHVAGYARILVEEHGFSIVS
jgi:hypothetical protein